MVCAIMENLKDIKKVTGPPIFLFSTSVWLLQKPNKGNIHYKLYYIVVSTESIIWYISLKLCFINI